MKEKYTVIIQRADGEKFNYIYYKGTNPFIQCLSVAIDNAWREFEMSNTGALVSAIAEEEEEKI